MPIEPKLQSKAQASLLGLILLGLLSTLSIQTFSFIQKSKHYLHERTQLDACSTQTASFIQKRIKRLSQLNRSIIKLNWLLKSLQIAKLVSPELIALEKSVRTLLKVLIKMQEFLLNTSVPSSLLTWMKCAPKTAFFTPKNLRKIYQREFTEAPLTIQVKKITLTFLKLSRNGVLETKIELTHKKTGGYLDATPQFSIF